MKSKNVIYTTLTVVWSGMAVCSSEGISAAADKCAMPSVDLSPFACEIVAANPPFHSSPLYSDPQAVLGAPTRIFQNQAWFGSATPSYVKIVEPAYNTDLDGKNVLLTIGKKTTGGVTQYGSVTVRFDHPIVDDVANPYGIDFLVFGNTMYNGSGLVSDSTDMAIYTLTGGAFAEPMLVSVSPDGENWYTYHNGPYCDDVFPTQGFEWNQSLFLATGCGWSEKPSDFTKPVNPALKERLGRGGISAATAITYYAGSGGGTGFDLAESGFSSIQYIRVEATNGYSDGELDAFSDVRPACLGETLTVSGENIIQGTSVLRFNDQQDSSLTVAEVKVFECSDNVFTCTAGEVDKNDDLMTTVPRDRAVRVFEIDFQTLPPSDDTAFVGADLALLLEQDVHYCDFYRLEGDIWVPIKVRQDKNGRFIVDNIGMKSILAFVGDKQAIAPKIEIEQRLGEIVLFFDVQTGRKYRLETSFSLDEPSWQEVENISPAFNTLHVFTQKLDATKRQYYRVVVVE